MIRGGCETANGEIHAVADQGSGWSYLPLGLVGGDLLVVSILKYQ